MKKLLLLNCLFFLLLFSNKSFAQEEDYIRIQGIYQLYEDYSPLQIQGLNIYYILNKKGVVLMAMGSSTGRAFYEISDGIKSGRIITGTFDLSGYSLSMKLGKGNEPTYWIYNPMDASITKERLMLRFIESL